MEPFIDIHCHVLPGIDDGPADIGEALAMAEMAVRGGITTIVATPHQLGSHPQNTAQRVRDAVAAFQHRLDMEGLPLRVLPGGDVRIDAELVEKIDAGSVLTLADRGHHVLLELPHDVYLPLDRLLADLAASGLVGILSHPERNRGLLAEPRLAVPLVQRGCLMQITAGSLTGSFGPNVQRFAESLLRQGLVHFVSTDAHGTKARRPILAAAFDRVVKLAGTATATDLFCRHPALVVAGRDIASTTHKNEKFARSSRFC